MSPAPRRLEHRVGSVRAHLEARTLRAVAILGVALLGFLLALAFLLAGPEGWRQGSDAPLLLDLVGGATLVGLVVLFRRGRGRWFGDAPLSRAMEGAAGLEDGLVRGALELVQPLPEGVSHALVESAAERTLARLGGPDEMLAGHLGTEVRGWSRRAMGALAAVALLLTGFATLAPTRALPAWAGLANPLRLAADPVLPPLVVGPGDVEVLRGSDVEIRLEARGRESVELAWQAAGDVARTGRIALSAGTGSWIFQGVSAPIEYRARTEDGASAGPFRIVPVDPLFVSDLRVEVAYPPHTGLPPEEFRGEVPPLVVPVGTRLLVEGRASRALTRAALLDPGGGEATAFAVEGLGFAGRWVPAADGTYAWDFLDDAGAPAEIQPEPLSIVLEPDRAPSVTIPLPGTDTIVPLSLRQPLILEAQDDYGLGRIELFAQRVTAFGERMEPSVQGLDLGGTRAALARPILDMTAWGLMPGDTVRYWAQVSDNAPAPGVARSREYVLWMPGAAQLRREAERQLDDAAARLEELAEEAARRAEETRDMEREASGEAERDESLQGRPNPEEQLGFDEQEELRRALEGQEEMTAEVDSLRGELEDLERTMEEAGQADPELQADLEELQQLLEEIAGEQMQERLDELREALDKQEMRDAEQAFDELADEQEDFRDRLEESLERFRRAAVEQDFRATRSEAEELAQQEDALSDAMKEADQPELRAEQQERLEERTETLQERMDRLQERLEQLGEDDAAREVQQAREKSAEARQQMAEAQQRSEAGRSEEAGEQAEEAARTMEEVSEELSEAQQQMAQQKAEAALRALQATADDALSLARRQTELGGEMAGASQDDLNGMRGDEASLLQGVRNMAQNLAEALGGEVGESREISTQMGRAMESIQRTIDAMENRRGPSPSPQAAAEQAVGDLNQLALMALAGAEQMSQGEGQGQPSPEQMAEQLEQLAQEQGDVNNQASQLMPLQLGEEAMQEQLQQLAEEQQQVAEDLEDLSDEPGSEEASLGDLEELVAEAQALAEQMAQGLLTPELTRRQEELFHRLLDAGRSLEQEEFSDERESVRPGAFEGGDVVPLSPEQLGALRFRLPDADQLQRLSPAVRQLVIQYFERLNRADRPGGGG